MKKKESVRKWLLKWYVNFLNEDLDALSDVEFATKWLTASYVFDWVNSREIMDDVEIFQVSPDALNRYLSTKNRQQRLKHSRDLAREVQAHLRNTARKIIDGELLRFTGVDVTLEPSYWFDEKVKGEVWMVSLSPESELDKKGTYSDHELWGKYGEINLIFLLQGLPIKTLRACKECGKLFLHFSKKDKFYCNPRCTSIALSRERREKDPDAYRKQQALIMRKQYRKKVAAEQGKPVEKVKIQKKRRKYQDEDEK